jgi:hypothetical protein
VGTHPDALFVGAAILKRFDHNFKAFRLGLLHRLLRRKHVEMKGLPAPTARGRCHNADQ